MIVPSRSKVPFVILSICRRSVIGNSKIISPYNSIHKYGCQQNIGTCYDLHRFNSYTTFAITSSESIRVLNPLHGRNINQPFSLFHTLQHHPDIWIGKLINHQQFKVRHKSKKKQHDSEDESDSDIDDNLDDDDFDAPSQFKVQTIHAPSLRIDAILSKALGLSRNRLEEIFFGPGFFLNGKKLLKKGGKMDEGDYVDVVMEKSDDHLRVKRVKLLKVGSQKTSTDKLIAKVRVWKVPFLIDDPNRWRHDS